MNRYNAETFTPAALPEDHHTVLSFLAAHAPDDIHDALDDGRNVAEFFAGDVKEVREWARHTQDLEPIEVGASEAGREAGLKTELAWPAFVLRGVLLSELAY